MKNYSKQREAIMQVLRSTNRHPTAAEVYDKVKEIIPNISLGTVYRNLTDLKQSGEIAGIMCEGVERFDGNVLTHLHLHCTECDRIYDVMLKDTPFCDIAEQMDFSVDNSVFMLNGICKNCRQIMVKNNGGN